jgi:predicted RNase H-like nuclease (RuvC/YqgF family)
MIKKIPALIIGFDILPQQSPSARKSPKYAMAIFKGAILESNGSVSRTELLKRVRKLKPDILATDNLFELASTEKGVIDYLSKIPSKTRIVQVTGSPIYGLTSITKLAKRYELQIERHPTPIESAILIAKLAALGVGTEISALARETRIIISRARNIGSGGFSQARFQRRMHGAIQQVARSIIDKIVKKQMDYDQYETRTAYGWSRCLIHVYDSFDNVSKIVQSETNRIAGVAVRISPVKHRTILYLQRKGKTDQVGPRQALVVGIDAGTTVGIAISDISGRVIALQSGRSLSRGDVIRYLVKFGKPILIAADVSPAPSFIEKLSTSLQAPLFVPEKLLSVTEKRELAKSFTKESNGQPKNAHQRDALAAIANVFHVYDRKLRLLHNRISESEHQHDVSEAIKLVLQGVSVHDALDQSVILNEEVKIESPQTELPKHEDKVLTVEKLQQDITQLCRQIASLQRQLDFEKNRYLQSQDSLTQLDKEYRQTKRKLNRALNLEKREQRRDELLSRKDTEIARLQKTIQKTQEKLVAAEHTISNLKLMRQLENRGEVQPILVLPRFSQEEIRQLLSRYSKKKSKIILIQNPSGGGSSTAEQLIQFGVQVIISKGKMSHLALDQFTSANIPVIEAKKLRITMVDEFAVVDIEQLHAEVMEWQKYHKATEHEEAADAIERLIEEYRHERRNEESERK